MDYRESERSPRGRSSNKRMDKEVLGHDNKFMYGVDTMSEDYDLNRIQYSPINRRGQPPQAWDYDF